MMFPIMLNVRLTIMLNITLAITVTIIEISLARLAELLHHGAKYDETRRHCNHNVAIHVLQLYCNAESILLETDARFVHDKYITKFCISIDALSDTLRRLFLPICIFLLLQQQYDHSFITELTFCTFDGTKISLHGLSTV